MRHISTSSSDPATSNCETKGLQDATHTNHRGHWPILSKLLLCKPPHELVLATQSMDPSRAELWPAVLASYMAWLVQFRSRSRFWFRDASLCGRGPACTVHSIRRCSALQRLPILHPKQKLLFRLRESSGTRDRLYTITCGRYQASSPSINRSAIEQPRLELVPDDRTGNIKPFSDNREQQAIQAGRASWPEAKRDADH